MKIKELREKNIEELKKLLQEKRGKTLSVRFSVSAKQVKNTKELRNEKKDIARILTLINEKKNE